MRERVVELPYAEFAARFRDDVPFHRIAFFRHCGALVWESDDLRSKLCPGEEPYSGSWHQPHSLHGRSPSNALGAPRPAATCALSSSPAATLFGFERPHSSSGGGSFGPQLPRQGSGQFAAAPRQRGGVASLLAATVDGQGGASTSSSPVAAGPRPRLSGGGRRSDAAAAAAASSDGGAGFQVGVELQQQLGGPCPAAARCTCRAPALGASPCVSSSGGSFSGSIGLSIGSVSGSSGDEAEEMAARYHAQGGGGGRGSSAAAAATGANRRPQPSTASHELCGYCQHLLVQEAAGADGGAADAWGGAGGAGQGEGAELRDYSQLPDSVWLSVLGAGDLGVRDLCYVARASKGLRSLSVNTPSLWSNIYKVGVGRRCGVGGGVGLGRLWSSL